MFKTQHFWVLLLLWGLLEILCKLEFQLGTNEAFKKETGKDALSYITDKVEKDHKKKKFDKKFTELFKR